MRLNTINENKCPRALLFCLPLYLLVIGALIAIWSFVPIQAAYAYVDPSVMTYTIQAVAGLAVALSAVIGVVFRRTRRKIYQLFNIDENARKISEQPIDRIDQNAPDAAERLEQARAAASRQAQDCLERTSTAARKLAWRQRFAFSLIMCIFVAFIVFIAPALEIFGSNADSLVFGLAAVWWIPVVFCLAFALVCALLLSLLNGKPFYIALLLLFCFGIAAYVQSLFMNQGMMPADGGFIGWTDAYFVNKMIISGIVWIAILVVPLIVSWRHSHLWLKATAGVACAVMIVQLVGVISVAFDSAHNSVNEQNKPYVTQGALLDVSPKSNVIVFVLDTYDTAILEDILAQDPHFLDSFSDFTYYKNSAGTMIPTTNAIPNLLTALKPQPGQDIAEYRRTKYENSTFLGDIHNLGYSIGIYSDSLMMDFGNQADRAVTEMTLNVHPVNRAPVDIWRTFVAMEQCALYREAPWSLKPLFWYYTSDINNRMIADSGSGNLNDSLYELDDAAILRLVREQQLKVADTSEAGAFRFIHLFGPHFPFSVDENGNEVGTNESDQIAQAKGSMKVVEEYLDQLKYLGLYDEATVIVTADHGVWYLTDDPVRAPISPIMLAKPSRPGISGDERAPVQVSAAAVSHDDIHGTVIAAMGGDKTRYGSTLFEESDPNRTRYFDALTSAGGEGQRFIEYAITGDVLDLANWSKTGNEWKDA